MTSRGRKKDAGDDAKKTAEKKDDKDKDEKKGDTKDAKKVDEASKSSAAARECRKSGMLRSHAVHAISVAGSRVPDLLLDLFHFCQDQSRTGRTRLPEI